MIEVREYTAGDVEAMAAIWNEVVAAGVAFPQEKLLAPNEAATFFAGQSVCGVAVSKADAKADTQADAKTEAGAKASSEAGAAARANAGGEARVPAAEILGVYIVHPNNVGRCGHIANASYAVAGAAQGKGVGRALVTDSLVRAHELGFRIMQFNAVVASNAAARHLYESLGFVQLGTIPGGFCMPDGTYADICPYYKELA